MGQVMGPNGAPPELTAAGMHPGCRFSSETLLAMGGGRLWTVEVWSAELGYTRLGVWRAI
eukprot:365987-Chlamydomonas_euryale.AAC.29